MLILTSVKKSDKAMKLNIVSRMLGYGSKMDGMTPQNNKDIDIINKSGLFDVDFYKKECIDVDFSCLDPIFHYITIGWKEGKNPNPNFNTASYANLSQKVLKDDENPFAHYIRYCEEKNFPDKGMLQDYSVRSINRCIKRIENYSFFDEKEYENQNSDIRGKVENIQSHAILYGISEGRDIFSKKRISTILGNECRVEPNYIISRKNFKGLLPKSIGVIYHSKGNSFIREIAQSLHIYLEESGLNSSLLTEQETEVPELCIFCGPHEFFFLPGCENWKKDEIISKAIMFNTEQPQTIWFARGFLYILMSAGVIDLCYQNLKPFSEAGLSSFHFDPPLKLDRSNLLPIDRKHALFRVLPLNVQKSVSSLTPFNEREIDVSFFGNQSFKREKFFKKSAEFFSFYNTFFYYRKKEGPICSSDVYDILSRLPHYVAKASKICLNLHRDDDSFFEWHRIIKHGLCSGAVVVSEECFPHPLYKPNVHFFVESMRHIPNMVEWLINSDDGKKKAIQTQNNVFNILNDKGISKSKYNDLKSYISYIWKEISLL